MRDRYHDVISDAEDIAIGIADCMNNHIDCYHYVDENLNQEVCRVYVGTVFSIDPCGRYHHVLTDDPDDPDTQVCGTFWQVLEDTLSGYDLILEFGDDPCDVFVTRILSE